MKLSEFVLEVLKVSEKAANLARVIRSEETLFELLVQEKKGDQGNKRFVHDFKTLADVLVQESVRHDLGAKFGSLAANINGEESNKFTNTLGESVVISVRETENETAALLCNVLDGNERAAALLAHVVHEDVPFTITDKSSLEKLDSVTLPEDSIGIWIDPIDSTAQYITAVEGPISETGVHSEGLRCVVVLIGAYDRSTGRPIFGCTNQPFVRFDTASQRWSGRYVWGASCGGLNVVGASSSLLDGIPDHPEAGRSIALSTSENPKIQSILRKHFNVVHAAGAGYKILCVADRLVGSYLLSKESTFKWDTCAPHAILLAQGGGILDFTAVLDIVKTHRGGVAANEDQLTQLLTEHQLDYCSSNPDCDESSVDRWGNRTGIIAYSSVPIMVEILQYLCDFV